MNYIILVYFPDNISRKGTLQEESQFSTVLVKLAGKVPTLSYSMHLGGHRGMAVNTNI